MREFEFPVAITAGSHQRVSISIDVGASHTAQEFIDEAFITAPIAAFLDLLSQWKMVEGRYRISALQDRVLGVEAAPDLLDAPWMIASIIALVDSATFLQDIDDDPFITSVRVQTPHMPDVHLESAFSDMERFSRECALELSPLLDGKFEIEGEPQSDWPSDARIYFFDMVITLDKPIPAALITPVEELFSLVEICLAGTAFEPQASVEELFDEGHIPFPSKVVVEDNTITYSVETPPSDISIPIRLVRDIINLNPTIEITDWTVAIREGW